MNHKKICVSIGIVTLLALTACGEETAVTPKATEESEITEAASAEPEPETVSEPEAEEDDGSYYMNGEYVVFGKYEQDGDETNGPEPVEWIILEDDGQKLFLISRYILDCHPYNLKSADVTWEDCDLRAWLNGEFYGNVFSPAAKERILITDVTVPDNEYYVVDGGNDTQDKLYCLSVDEIMEYYEVDKWYEEQQLGFSNALFTDMTDYAEKNGADRYTITQEEYETFLEYKGCDSAVVGKSSGGWWLRSPGRSSDWACMVSYDGSFGWGYDSYVDFARNGVRPVMYIEK